MKSLIKPCLLAGCLFLISGNVFAQSTEDISELEQVQVESENASDDNAESVVVLNESVESEDDLLSDDLDDMFNDSSDTEAIITAPPAQENDSLSKKGIFLTGNLASRLGGYIYVYPFDIAPGATFESKVSFASRPNDYFSIHGSLLVSFPQMQIGLYELYINYNLWNYAYIMAGKKDVHWGNARIFDTNILDDKNNNPDEHNPEKLLYDNETDIDKSRFTVQLSVPINMVNIVGLVDYKNYKSTTLEDLKNNTVSASRDLSYAVMVEANLSNISFDVFWKMWAENDPGRYDPCVGINANFTVGDFHFYGQYYTHVNTQIDGLSFPRMKATGSVWWATREKYNLGFILEYQMIYDYYGYGKQGLPDSSEYFKNYIAFEGVWGRINGSPFTLALKYFHDFYEGYGTIIPGVKWHDILPNADLDFGIPIYYGTQQKYGVAIQLKLDVNF